MFDIDKVWTSSIDYNIRLIQGGETCQYKSDVTNSSHIAGYVCCGPDQACLDPVEGVCSTGTLDVATRECAKLGMEVCRDSRLCSRCKETKCYQDGGMIFSFKT